VSTLRGQVHFASLWYKLATRLGLNAQLISDDRIDPATELPIAWRHGVDASVIEGRLKADTAHTIKAVCVVHNETSTGVTSDIASVRAAIDAAQHPALLLVDTISGLASAEYLHDGWGVDVSISGSQKGLMLPPGISFNAISDKALKVSETANLSKAYWDWKEILASNEHGYWPYTPNTNLLYGLNEACDMLLDPATGGLEAVLARHTRWGRAVRAAVDAWGLQIQCADPACYSPALTGVVMPNDVNADQVRQLIYQKFNCSLGTGLGKIQGRMFRIGHLGYSNDLTLVAGISACEMGLQLSRIPLKGSGVLAAMRVFQAS
jgi:alanine-glyoxylate transaminase / serine-glyoxylate transaminase / serine-pyruvate transaminase